MLIDMHNHTEHGSQDSIIRIDQLIQLARNAGWMVFALLNTKRSQVLILRH
jgi:hypothetical protein